MENFEFTYNVLYDTFTHEDSGYMISGDYLRTASNDEVVLRVFNATGVEVDEDIIEALRIVSEGTL